MKLCQVIASRAGEADFLMRSRPDTDMHMVSQVSRRIGEGYIIACPSSFAVSGS